MNIRRASLADVFNPTNQENETEEEACNQKGESGGSMAMLLGAAATAVMAVLAGAPGIVGTILAAGECSAIGKDISLGYQDLDSQNKLGHFKLPITREPF